MIPVCRLASGLQQENIFLTASAAPSPCLEISKRIFTWQSQVPVIIRRDDHCVSPAAEECREDIAQLFHRRREPASGAAACSNHQSPRVFISVPRAVSALGLSSCKCQYRDRSNKPKRPGWRGSGFLLLSDASPPAANSVFMRQI